MKFQGNPKFLFLYLNHYHSNINPYWIADTEEQVNYIRELGFQSLLMNSPAANQLFSIADVYVVENFREHLPETINPNIIIANLWHGVGLKHIEFGLDKSSPLTDSVVRKNIRNYSMFHNNLAFLSTSEFMENHFIEEMRLSPEQFIRGVYPRNIVANDAKLSTFNHSIISDRNLDSFDEIILFSPTYRDSSQRISLFTLFEDVELLNKILLEKNALLIFKMHHFEEKNKDYLDFKDLYKTLPNFLFWEEQYDIYEIFHKITLGIIDYSSIYYDLLQAGVSKFIRYVPDIEIYNSTRGIKFDYLSHTGGSIAYTFNQLIKHLYSSNNQVKNKDELLNLFFGFDNKYKTQIQKMNELISSIKNFKIKHTKYKTLFSFDIFDTLICRKNVESVSIFFEVKEKMKSNNLKFSDYFIDNYPRIRQEAESELRDVYRKTTFERNSEKYEITLEEIFRRLSDNFRLNKKQVNFLIKTEIELEINNARPITSRIEQLIHHSKDGDDIILISDMYLPKDVILKMLTKVDPRLTEFKLYLSSEIGDQKSTGKLYKHIFFDLDYKYKEWIHFGDNNNADHIVPHRFGIKTRHHQMNTFLGYEKGIINYLKNDSAYQIAGLINHKRWSLIDQSTMNFNTTAYYAYSYVSALYVPYILWAIKDAISRKYKTIYFISRDGHYLKAIADEIIKMRNYPIKTKLIYGSRKAWRLAAQIGKIDDEFFEPFGLFTVINSYKEIIRASQLTENELITIIPQIKNFKNTTNFTSDIMKEIRYLFSSSEIYKERLLEIGATQRKLVSEYLSQEINFNESFTFVEYWGRGYTQDLLARLLSYSAKKKVPTPCYYIRNYTDNIKNSIRHRFMQLPINYTFVEAIFATTPYKSIPGYKYDVEKNRVEAIFEPQENEYHNIITNELINFTKDFINLNLNDEDSASRMFAEYSVRYQQKNVLDHFLINVYSSFKDNVNSFGDVKEISPAFSMELVENNTVADLKKLTANLETSIVKSEEKVQKILLDKCKKEGITYKQTPKAINVFPVNKLSNYIRLDKIPKLVYLTENHAVYDSIIFNQNNKMKYTILKGSIVEVINIVWMTGGIPRLLTKYGYITAHIGYVKNYQDEKTSEEIYFGQAEILGAPAPINIGNNILALEDLLTYKDPDLTVLSDSKTIIPKGSIFTCSDIIKIKETVSSLKVNDIYINATSSHIKEYILPENKLIQLNGFNIMLLKSLPIYKDFNLTQKTNNIVPEQTCFNKILIEQCNDKYVLRVSNGFIELKTEHIRRIRNRLSDYFFSTDNKSIKALCNLKIYKDVNFNYYTEDYIKKGTIFNPNSIEWTEKGTPRFKIDNGYVSTNKKFVEKVDKIQKLSLLEKIKSKLNKFN